MVSWAGFMKALTTRITHKQIGKIFTAGNLPNQVIKVERQHNNGSIFPFRIKVMGIKGSQRIPHWPAKSSSSTSYVPNLI